MIDGEHYPPVTRAALESISAGGNELAGAVLAGGTEKLPDGRVPEFEGLDVRTGADPREVLDRALRELAPDAVVDLSDEPVLDYRRRHELAAIALFHGVPYRGMDFTFTPPPRPRLATRPSVAIIGTGKRTGKTSISGFTARAARAAGRTPIIVAMGRGGPPEPEVLHGEDVQLEPRDLLELAESGKHAASDYVEDALLGRVTTIGCRRCGGGLAGGVDISNVAEGVALTEDMDHDLLILEGSGTAIPPVHADATVLVAPANIPVEYLTGYFGPYRLLLADLVVVTMCEEPFGSLPQISHLTQRMQSTYRPVTTEPQGEIPVVRTVFRPTPTRSVEGASVYVATTAPEVAADAIRGHLEEEHDCEVVGVSHSLSDRKKLRQELDSLRGEADTLLCEIKAAGIDVATRWALDKDMDVVYMDNVPVSIDEADPAAAVLRVAELAEARFDG